MSDAHGSGKASSASRSPARHAEQVRGRAGMPERDQAGVDPVLQLHPMMHQMQPEPGPFPLGSHPRVGQPDRRDQIPAGQLGQHPGIDPVGLARQRRQTLHLLGIGDLDVPAGQLEACHARTGRRSSTRSPPAPDPPPRTGPPTGAAPHRSGATASSATVAPSSSSTRTSSRCRDRSIPTCNMMCRGLLGELVPSDNPEGLTGEAPLHDISRAAPCCRPPRGSRSPWR